MKKLLTKKSMLHSCVSLIFAIPFTMGCVNQDVDVAEEYRNRGGDIGCEPEWQIAADGPAFGLFRRAV